MTKITKVSFMNNTARRVSLTGAFAALTVVLGITHLGMIPLGPTASVTILQIPVILIVLLSGLPEGLFVGAAFGIMSLVLAAMSPSGVLDPFFVNPLCSVLPRMLLAVAAWGVWKLLNLIPKMPKIVSAGVTGFVATLLHTVMVIGSLYVFQPGVKDAMGGMGFGGLMAVLLPQACLEAAASTIVCAAVIGALVIVKGKKSKLSEESTEE